MCFKTRTPQRFESVEGDAAQNWRKSMKRTNNTRKGGNQVSLDDALTARGICEKSSVRLTIISPEPTRTTGDVGNLPGQSAQELLGREWNHFVPNR
ncbi:MAG: hypothetical protein RLZZ76_71 [Candidatus Parcubacteria bacterium]|jgi:hypothetical protein